MRRLAGLFWRDERGVFMVIAVIILPVIALFSLATVDYSNTHLLRSQVQLAADSAALAMAQAQVLSTGEVELNGNEFLTANIPDMSGLEITSRRVETVTLGHVIVEVDVAMNTLTSQLLSTDDWAFTIRAEARFDDPQDIDFAVLMDRSPSMLLGATQADMDAIGVINDGLGNEYPNCAFACHYGESTYTLSRGQGIDTRLDVAKRAVTRAFERAEANSQASGGDIVAHVFTFRLDVEEEDSGLVQHVLARRTVDNIEPAHGNEIDETRESGTNQTNINNALREVNAKMSDIRRRNEDHRRFLMLITDGVSNYQTVPNTASYKMEPVDPRECEALKSNGVTVAVIYTTYFPLPGHFSWDPPGVSTFASEILPKLRECASPGWFFEAAFTEDIDRAVATILDMALPKPQLTF